MSARTYDKTNDDFKNAENERRLKDACAARSLYETLKRDNEQRSKVYATTRNQLEGGRPWEPSVLRKQGTEWQTNVNFGDAQAARDRTLIPYWQMVHEVPRTISINIDTSAPDANLWSVAMEEAFDMFLDDWGQDYKIQYMRGAKNLVDFGPFIVKWEDEDNPRYKTVNVQRMLFPKNTRMSVSDWECVAFESEMGASELWSKIRNKKQSSASSYVGWNPDAIKKALIASNQTRGNDGNDWTKVQDRLVNNDLSASSSQFSPTEIVWIYVKQFNGEIGCYAIARDGDDEEFLFSKDNYAKDFKDIFGAVWYDTGTDGMVHSIKGFAIKNFHYSLLLNRMKSRVVDGASISMAMNFMRTPEMPDEAPPMQSYGSVNVFPEGLQQIQTYPQFGQGLNIIEMLSQNQASNNSLYRQQQQQIQDSDTATQANILATMQSQVTEATAALYLTQVGESIFEPIFNRLRKKGSRNPDAVKFIKRCVAKGVPEDVIYMDNITVKTGANAGLASPQMRAMKFQRALGLMNSPGVNGQWFLRQYIASEFGSQAVKKAFLPEGQNGNQQQRRAAMIENASMGDGMPLPVDMMDAHVEHIEEHMKPLAMQVQQFTSNGGNIPKENIIGLVVAAEHTAEHFAYLQKDDTRKEQFRALIPEFRNVQSVIRGMITRMQNEQREAAQEQQEQSILRGTPPVMPVATPQIAFPTGESESQSPTNRNR